MDINEDVYADDFGEKKFIDKNGKTKIRKLRPHHIYFANSKMGGVPAQEPVKDTSDFASDTSEKQLKKIYKHQQNAHKEKAKKAFKSYMDRNKEDKKTPIKESDNEPEVYSKHEHLAQKALQNNNTAQFHKHMVDHHKDEIKHADKSDHEYHNDMIAHHTKYSLKEGNEMNIDAQECLELIENSQLDEISKKTLGSYIKKATDDVNVHSHNAGIYRSRKNGIDLHPDEDSKEQVRLNDKKSTKRMVGINKAVDKLTKEDLDEGLTYHDFQAKMAAHKQAGSNVIDAKYTEKKQHYTVVDKEGTARKVTHTDAGSKMENLGQHDGSDKPSADKKPRGRPAGAKSGANNQ